MRERGVTRKNHTVKTTYHHGRLRRALIEAAGTLVDIRGLEAVSLRAAAKRAGVSEAAPYRHFANGAALRAAVAAEGFGILQADLDLAFDDEGRAAAYLTFARDYPGRYRLMFGAAETGAEVAALAEELGGADRLAALHGRALLEIGGLWPETVR